MRFEACLPQSWWEFAVEYAVHIYNRTPIRYLKWCTPYEALNSVLPDISHLRVLGCGAYIFIPEDVRINKLAPRAELMTFIGYTNGTKGFKFIQKPNNNIFQAVVATFDEYMFPLCPDFRSQGHTCVGANHPNTEDNISLEDGFSDDGGAYPYMPSGGGGGNFPPGGPPVPPVPPQTNLPPARQGPSMPPQGSAYDPLNEFPGYDDRWPLWQRRMVRDMGWPQFENHPPGWMPLLDNSRNAPPPPPRYPPLPLSSDDEEPAQGIQPSQPVPGPSQAAQPRRSGRD
jgi:hypothetical protein